jgi:hypothetical protein
MYINSYDYSDDGKVQGVQFVGHIPTLTLLANLKADAVIAAHNH